MLTVPVPRRGTPQPGSAEFTAAADQLFEACRDLAGQGRATAGLHPKAIMTFGVPYEPHFRALWEAVQERLKPESIELDWNKWDVLVVPRAEVQGGHWNGSFSAPDHVGKISDGGVTKFLVVVPTRLRYLTVDRARQTAAQLLAIAEHIESITEASPGPGDASAQGGA